MYLFSRVRTAKASRMLDALSLATEARDLVRDKTELDVSLHTAMFGRPVGTFTWAVLVEGRAQLTETMTGLLADSDYLDLIDRAGDVYVDGGHDYFRRIVQMDGVDIEAGPPSMSQGWTSQIANGQYDHAMDWATDAATFVHELTGTPVATMADAYGAFGTVTWIGLFDSAGDVDRTADLMESDPEWVKRLTYAEDFFIPGSGHVWLNRRVD